METSKAKRKLGFWGIYAIVFAVIAMAVVGLLGYLWKYLSAYEQSRPMRVAKEAVARLAEGEAEQLLLAELSPFESGALGDNVFARLSESESLDVAEKAGVSTAEKPVFAVRAEGKEILTVRLTPSGRNTFFQCWEVEGVSLTRPERLVLTVVEGVKLRVNGVEVGEEYIAERDIPLDGYADFPQEAPRCVRYELPPLCVEPVVELEGSESAPRAERTQEGWRVSYSAEGGEREKAVAIAAAKEYVAFASDEEAPIDALDRYLVKGSVLRARMLSFDRKYFARHDSASMENVTASDYCVYGENVCSVKVTYDYRMITDGKEYVDPSAMIMYLIRTSDGWRLAEVATLS